ncbi:MAG TPA: ion transporter [Flavobacteriales bacterium]|nr:ion transporter [Flavobacteriales bacterium]
MENTDKRISNWDLIAVLLSVYVLIALMMDTFFQLPEETSRLLQYIDNLICCYFLVDFTIRFIRAENKMAFMKWGWIDLVSSIPAWDLSRVGRVVRLIRLLRVLRAFRSVRMLARHVLQNRIQGTFTSMLLIAIMLVLSASIAILQVEHDPAGNIHTAEDALWWSYVTITTVGYGDKFPITTEGRIIAAVLMTAGVGLFGTFTAMLASWFVQGQKEQPE